MITGELDAALFRAKYLGGLPMPPSWLGSEADDRIELILQQVRETAQTLLNVRFCLERVLTWPDPSKVLGVDYEVEGEPLMYTTMPMGASHHVITLPFSPVRSNERVRVFYGPPVQYPTEGQIATIDRRWINFNAKVGVLRIVPTTLGLSTTPWANIGTVGFYWPRAEVPGVWAVDYTMGLGRIPYDVARWIGLTAKRDVLGLMGIALTGGATSGSLSMDGVTESTGYSSSKYGVYGPAMEAVDKELACLDLGRLRAAHKGLKIGAF